MNSNLTPEPRTDKNGKISTRWVKPGVSSSKATAALPAPKPIPSLRTPNLHASFARANLQQRDFTTADLDHRTVIAVEELLASVGNDHESVTVRSEINDLVFGALKTIRDGYADDYRFDINNVAVFGKTLKDDGECKGRIHRYIAGMHRNEAFTDISDFLLEATDEQRAQAIALVHFANTAPEPWSKNYYGYDNDGTDIYGTYSDADAEEDFYVAVDGEDPEGLTRFIMEHHEQVDDIIRIITERQSDDLVMLESLLGHTEQSLRSGLL
jgi:hypothetical protein